MSPADAEWMTQHFGNTKNADIAEHFGINPRTATRLAREMGLVKSEEFIAATQQNAARHAAVVNAGEGNKGKENLIKYGKKYRFKEGEKQRDRMEENAYKDMLERRGKSLSKVYKAEHRRVIFGLEQKTNLRVVSCSRKKVGVRNRLRKEGYYVSRASNEALLADQTQRSVVLEQQAESVGIKIIDRRLFFY